MAISNLLLILGLVSRSSWLATALSHVRAPKRVVNESSPYFQPRPSAIQVSRVHFYGGERKVVAMNTSSNTSLCVGGKLFPELYILGGPKCATTSIGTDMLLRGTGISTACIPRIQSTECHFFDEHWFFMRRPKCPPVGTRQVAADFTPRNLRLVELPEEVRKTRVSRNQSLPQYLLKIHGDQAGRLVFVVLLREPLSMLQSLWYHGKSNFFLGPCTECKGSSFSASLERALDRATADPPRYEDWLWMTMFGRQLDKWLQNFDARQFMIIPYKAYTAEPAAVCTTISAQIQYPLNCSQVEEVAALSGATHANGHAHPSLLDDTTSLLRSQFDSVMLPEEELLIEVLDASHQAGAILMNFTGAEAEDNATNTVQTWLKASWGGSDLVKSKKLYKKTLVSFHPKPPS